MLAYVDAGKDRQQGVDCLRGFSRWSQISVPPAQFRARPKGFGNV
jgi:hypothetical protein